MWKEAVVVYMKVLSQHSCVWTEGSDESHSRDSQSPHQNFLEYESAMSREGVLAHVIKHENICCFSLII
jgi:uncharacterized damage-inducible protein DinB